ncbi:hypothetical protein ACF6ZU_28700 [Pseudomonas migulae]|jgi:hypothetical protein|uniref:hypothetical protein n=1 Tax=Pseudomonas migulae TaxID=78543 RepID=UPI0037249E80
MSEKVESGSENTYWAKVIVNGKQVQKGDEVILLSERDNEIKIEDAPVGVSELRLGLADGEEQKFISNPPFNSKNLLIDRSCSWAVTPQSGADSSATLVVYTAEIPPLMELRCSVSDFDIRFIYLTDDPIPHPPAQVAARVNVLYASGVLATSKGEPAGGVTVTFNVPEHGAQTLQTGPAGKASMAPIIYKTAGTREISAVAEFSDGDRTIKMLVDVRS